jgi:5-hydroxyisourate hydrolase
VPGDITLAPGRYRLTFDTGRYFDAQRVSAFYTHVTIVFETAPHETHYHVPLLLSPYGYSTYRGS